jgi:septal ring factor EnvC (AmiA/AmiB activator)
MKETDSTASLATADTVMITTPRLASPPPPKTKKASVPSQCASLVGAKKKTPHTEEAEAGEGRQRTESVRNLTALDKAMKLVQNWDQGDPPRGYGAYAQQLFELSCPPAFSREYNSELAEVTLAHCVRNIYTARIEEVNILTKMQDSTVMAEGAEVPPSVVWQIIAERARLEEDREVVRLEREELDMAREDGVKAVTDLEARLAAVSQEKADLEK